MAEELAKTLADAMSALPKELIIFVVSIFENKNITIF